MILNLASTILQNEIIILFCGWKLYGSKRLLKLFKFGFNKNVSNYNFFANYWAFYWIDPNTGNLNRASSYFRSKFHKSGHKSYDQNSARWHKKLFNNYKTSSGKKFGAPNCWFGQSVYDKERNNRFSNIRLLWLKASLMWSKSTVPFT